jgi:hypothetical protein
METQKNIQSAQEVIRKMQSAAGKKGSRVHQESLETNTLKARALNGLCGNCLNLTLCFYGKSDSPYSSVSLGCIRRHSPVEMYRNTPLGQEATCDDFSQKAK